MDQLDEYVKAVKEVANGLDMLWTMDVVWSDTPSVSKIVNFVEEDHGISEGDWVRVIDQVNSDDLKKFLAIYIATKSRSRAEASIAEALGKHRENRTVDVPIYQRLIALGILLIPFYLMYTTFFG